MKIKKITKIFAATGLAVMMGIGTLCGFLLAPMNSAQASVGGGVTNSTTSPLGLDPENDPVIAITESGLEIKYHQIVSKIDFLGTGALVGYPYVTMGTYNNNPINWVIIGQGERSSFIELDNTPAGIAIQTDEKRSKRTIIKNETLYYEAFGCVVQSNELEETEVLVLSEGGLGTQRFNPSYGSSAIYYGSECYTAMNNFYKTGLGFTEEDYLIIMPKKIGCHYYNESTIRYIENQYLFPMATRDENFSFLTYLPNKEQRICYNIDVNTDKVPYWTRSGDAGTSNYIYLINESGTIYGSSQNPTNYYMRPAFVLKLF